MSFVKQRVGVTLIAMLVLTVLLSVCGNSADLGSSNTPQIANIDNSAWNYNEEDDVYWQVQVQYCENPADLSYETLGIFVPAAYMNAADNGDGTYTCTINTDGEVAGYTAATAPIVIPVDTPGYAAMLAPTDYVSAAADYTDAGFIYVNAGCRGRDAGAPAGVTDLKAAVRYIRYNEGIIPGSVERIFTFGMSGGGAQSALMGATGDSELYTPYLTAIGVVEGCSDAVAGSMCWCPITNLDYADEAYEWNMGSTRSDLSDDMQTLSDGMAVAFAEYINELGLTDSQGNVLTLTESEEGIYQAGSYYDYVKSEVERSLNNFLTDTSFPYTTGGSVGMGGMGNRGGMHGNGDVPDDNGANLPDGNRRQAADGNAPDGTQGKDKMDKIGGMDGAENKDVQMNEGAGGYVGADGQFRDDGINRTEISGSTESKTYETAQAYIDDLNKDGVWISYDSSANTATITSVADFVAHCKTASKSVGAFDDLNGTQGENTLFGYSDGNGAHFDPVMAQLLAGTEYADAYAADLQKLDSQGNTVDTRVNMYNPMYYLCDYYDGYKTANVASYWRIRTGIDQGDTALSTEINLTLALENYGRDVDFETVWGLGHTMAERTGNSTENFIQWVNDCLQ
jgi:hypothetical protein